MRLRRPALPRAALTVALLGILSLADAASPAAVSAYDDARQLVSLSGPAQRIVSLAPHATELLFAAGAGAQVVAVSDYSDYPPAAAKLPSVGNVFALDTERLLALKPDLVVVWGTGNGRQLVQKLRQQHIRVFESDPGDFETIASSIERLGTLAGSSAVANPAAAEFRQRLQSLRQRYASNKPPVSVFYQVWQQPLMTINDKPIIAAAIRLCGGSNVFGKLAAPSPTVAREAVLAANPDAIITAGKDLSALQSWQDYPVLRAVRQKHLYAIDGDALSRAGPRILDGTEALCKAIQSATTAR